MDDKKLKQFKKDILAAAKRLKLKLRLPPDCDGPVIRESEFTADFQFSIDK